jgi:nucleotide-binding universal stress UspA family protein
LPAYISYAEAAFPGSERIITDERHAFYANLQKEAQAQAEAQGISAEGIIVDGDEIQSLVDDLNNWQADLLVIGRRHHSSLSGRLWGSTVHEVAEKARCSIFAVL